MTDRDVVEVASCLETTDEGNLGLSRVSDPFSGEHIQFVTEEWVRGNGENGLWLPEEYRATAVATRGNVVVMGHASGAIAFVNVA